MNPYTTQGDNSTGAASSAPDAAAGSPPSSVSRKKPNKEVAEANDSQQQEQFLLDSTFGIDAIDAVDDCNSFVSNELASDQTIHQGGDIESVPQQTSTGVNCTLSRSMAAITNLGTLIVEGEDDDDEWTVTAPCLSIRIDDDDEDLSEDDDSLMISQTKEEENKGSGDDNDERSTPPPSKEEQEEENDDRHEENEENTNPLPHYRPITGGDIGLAGAGVGVGIELASASFGAASGIDQAGRDVKAIGDGAGRVRDGADGACRQGAALLQIVGYTVGGLAAIAGVVAALSTTTSSSATYITARDEKDQTEERK
jgi:hypothetical protein